ncbi:hypothetical protein KTT_28190 [Tengunoibacter tsumagoiensis]|uniref:Uncharacterized protein n=1 Tax=Tengunoibacter tsumagoiensis TaxID=2014871 RepID=A0A402A1C1_9CHLR|nr:hypothetical protein KTT_28190 [Tengunoibacter tsumagoiensis]
MVIMRGYMAEGVSMAEWVATAIMRGYMAEGVSMAEWVATAIMNDGPYMSLR